MFVKLLQLENIQYIFVTLEVSQFTKDKCSSHRKLQPLKARNMLVTLDVFQFGTIGKAPDHPSNKP
jgi:hypothetical protein